jgi:Kef-type K+ transport system membrane component KefB
MRQLFTKPIEMPQQAAIIILISVLCGLAYLGGGHGGFVVSQLAEMFAYFFGPLLCLYLFFRMFCDICFRSSGKHPVAFLLGTLFGFGTFFIWYLHYARVSR